MADHDEDALLSSSFPGTTDENDIGDELPDFRLLASLSKTTTRIPKRGEKDFESHGTKQQVSILDSSRQAMHDALAFTRVHTPKNHNRGFYYGVEVEGGSRDEVVPEEWRGGLGRDHVVFVESEKGASTKNMGRMTTGKKGGCTWLLPEEALYLVERGSLDLWWPSRGSYKGMPAEEDEEEEGGDRDEEEEGGDRDEGYPLSLQAAYSFLIGEDGERGKVSLHRFTVYTNLKRVGYTVMRAPDWDPSVPSERPRPSDEAASVEESSSVFNWLFGRAFAERKSEDCAYGPLVKPGMYRSYNSIYQQMAAIPRHKPSAVLSEAGAPTEEPFRVVFWLWKASKMKDFKKSEPGLPDYRLAIVDARASSLPTLTQVSSLIESSPWNAPGAKLQGPNQVNQRLKHGYRNVVLAVVDAGVASFLQLSESGFGEERLHERFDGGLARGTKRGGGGGRGRGRGRGGGGGRGGEGEGGGRGRGRGRGRG